MVDTGNDVKLNMDLLIMFKCPSHTAENTGLFCIFSSMRDLEKLTGLKCKTQACEIRIPKEAKSD